MKIKSWWFLLQIMFIIFIILAILNAILMPKISANKYNLYKSKSVIKLSAKNDMKILFSIKHLKYIWLIIVCIFIQWAYFYSSYGYWLKGIFHLNQAQFGTYAALMEGIINI